MEILRGENLSFSYPNVDKKAINNIDFRINRGEFIVICGESGCGKTTLLKLIKKELAPAGQKNGRIFYNGEDITELNNPWEIGYVWQNPDSQIVTDKVWRELAFGPENMGLPSDAIKLRVSEMANYFGVQDWFEKDVDKLSGGQKQLLNLASVMVTQPKVLLLDEPTSQLDPIAAADFIATLKKLNEELGLTIILAEHRLEDVFPIADRIIIMEEGRILACDEPKKISASIDIDHKMQKALPSAVRIFNGLNMDGECPVTVREGRAFIEKNFRPCESGLPLSSHSEKIVLEGKNLWFRYEKQGEDVLKGAEICLYESEFLCILGGNGAGKTTLLNVISGIDKPYRGKIRTEKNIKIGYLPQDPTVLFLKDSVKEDLEDMTNLLGVDKGKISEVCKVLDIEELMGKHPYDLSGGEIQKCATAKLLLRNPDILLMDEPTKGLDAWAKEMLGNIIVDLKKIGVCIVAVSHDLEFAAEHADRCGMFFNGEITVCDIPERFFSQNNFYTTAANRMGRGLFKNAVTCQSVIENCLKQSKTQEIS